MPEIARIENGRKKTRCIEAHQVLNWWCDLHGILINLAIKYGMQVDLLLNMRIVSLVELLVSMLIAIFGL